MRRLSDDWRYLARGEVAVGDLLEGVGIEKAVPGAGVLTRAGFDGVVRRLVGKLTHVTGKADAAALRRAAKLLDRRWDGLTAAERDRVIGAAAQGFLAVPKLVIPKVETILRGDLTSVVEATKAAVGERHGLAITADLNTQDAKVVDFAASSQGSYITDQYGVRATAYEQRARDIVADGLDKGLGRADIADMLRDELTSPMLGRAASYWDQVASIHVARARSYGQLSGYTEAGIERFVNSAALDEVTCVICRFMNGREFEVETSIDRFHEVEASGDPYAVTERQPFVKVGRTEDGDRFLYAESGGEVHHIADVIDDATGERDEEGRYGRAASEGKLAAIGVTEAPFHGRCRCTTEPV
jgi:hypothetical protein